MTTSIQVARLFALSFLCAVASVAQSQTGTLTKPNQPKLTVPKPPPPVSLTIPNQPPSVPSEMPVVEHQEHMAFQKTEDALSSKIDVLTERSDGFKATLAEHHTDIESLKDTRTHWTVWVYVGAFGWLALGIFGLTKEKLIAWFHQKFGNPANGAIALHAADATPPTKTNPPPD